MDQATEGTEVGPSGQQTQTGLTLTTANPCMGGNSLQSSPPSMGKKGAPLSYTAIKAACWKGYYDIFI